MPLPTARGPDAATIQSDFGSVSRLEPTDRRVIDVVGKRDLAQRLTCCHTLQGFARLTLGQLRLPAKSYALGHGASAARAPISVVTCSVTLPNASQRNCQA